ncbi:NAD(P)-binding protein [Aspergillus alliaceus]|uniref:NAD(P)-binding protein n=1 Tax=Petromyces alliaceus TaxID=209559 RepID=UPI0012A666BF|nr:NAD(P)-binding protein [Aspergillus alliaceus]KAB8227301.1 NAD(P)-binding protein [Aspergillus alliaceus]
MATTTYPKFNENTEALDVAGAFASEIRGKTIMVTGVNRGGTGLSTTQAFEFPKVNYRGLQVDFPNLESVRNAAYEIMSWADVPTINIVINSAGIMGIQERTLSQDGIELHCATNHLGHWLLTCLIMPKLIKAAESNPTGATRVVNVSSASVQASGMRWSDMNFERRNKDLPAEEEPNYESLYVPLDGYNRSKGANVLFGIAANKRLFDKHGMLTLSLHPGVIDTELGRNMSLKDLEAFADLVAALDPKLAQGVGKSKNGSENWGSYLDSCQISGKAHPLAISSEEAEKLWDVSERLVGQTFAW